MVASSYRDGKCVNETSPVRKSELAGSACRPFLIETPSGPSEVTHPDPSPPHFSPSSRLFLDICRGLCSFLQGLLLS